MVVKFDKPTKSSSGTLNNTGSCAAFVGYLGKEDKELAADGIEPQQWFDHQGQEHHPAAVRVDIDQDHRGIGKTEGKFATGSINPTAKEWEALGRNDSERLENFKNWIAKNFSQEFAENFNKKDKAGSKIRITPDNVKIRYKIEFERHYKGTEEAVKNREHKQGERKEGVHVHCHFIVARNAVDKVNGMNTSPNRISPTTPNRKEFDRDGLTQKVEASFDKVVGYSRPLEESYQYMKAFDKASGEQKIELIAKGIADNVELSQKPAVEQMQKQEQKIQKDKGFNINL